jgi:hypothetical protein
LALVTSSSFTGLFRPTSQADQVASGVGATRLVQAGRETEPVDTRPTTPGRLSAPLPHWLGSGPSNKTVDPSDGAAAGGPHTVEPHDTLWGIAAAQLVPADRSATRSGSNFILTNETDCSHGPRKFLNGVLSDFHVVLVPPGRSKAITECSGKPCVRLEPRLIPASRVFPGLLVATV